MLGMVFFMSRTCNLPIKEIDYFIRPLHSQPCILAFQSTETCGAVVRGGDGSGYPRVVSLTVTTKNNVKYDLRDAFALKMEIKTFGQIGGYWEGTFDNNINVRRFRSTKHHLQKNVAAKYK